MAVIKKQLTVEAKSDFNRLFADLDKLNEKFEKLGGGRGGKSGVEKTNQGFTKLQANIVSANQALQLMSTIATRAGSALRFLTKDFAFLEQRLIAFRTLTGSLGLGESLFGELKQLAQDTPISLTESFEGAERLLAFGIEVRNVKDDLFALGNIAAGVGKEKLGRLILAFGQVKTATHLTGQELRQFAESGVPILEELAKASNRTAAEVKADMFLGLKPSFEEVRAAIHAMSGEGGKFNDLLKEQAETLAGLQQITADKFKLMMDDIAKATGIADLYKESLKGIADLMDRISGSLNAGRVPSDPGDVTKSAFFSEQLMKAHFRTGGPSTFSQNRSLSSLSGHAYKDIGRSTRLSKKLNENRDELTRQIKDMEKLVKDKEALAKKFEAENKGSSFTTSDDINNTKRRLQKELVILKTKEASISKILVVVDEQINKLKSQRVTLMDKEINLFKIQISDKNQKQLEELIETKNTQLVMESDSLDLAEKRANLDGFVRDNEEAELKRRRESIELEKQKLKLVKDRLAIVKSLTPATPNSNDPRFISMMDHNPFDSDRDSMTESMKRHLEQQRIFQAEIRKINNATYLDEKEKDELTENRKKQLQTSQRGLWSAYASDALEIMSIVADTYGKKSKQMFEFSKALAYAQALMAGYSAVNQVFDDPTLTTYEKYVHAILIGAKTTANVIAIENTRFGGKGSASSSKSFSGVVTAQSRDSETFENMSRRADLEDSRSKRENLLLQSNERMERSLDDISAKM